MIKPLYLIAALLLGFAAGEQYGLYLRRPITVLHIEKSEAAPAPDSGNVPSTEHDSCTLSWVICWKSA